MTRESERLRLFDRSIPEDPTPAHLEDTMSLIGRIVTKILGNDDPRTRPDSRPYDDRVTYNDSGNLVGRLVTKILRR